jgi:hypothetical protein
MGYVTAPNPGRIWVPAAVFATPGGATNSVAANREVWRLRDSANDSISCCVRLPDDYASGSNLEVYIHYLRQGGSAGNVVWKVDYMSTVEGEAVAIGSLVAGTQTAPIANADTNHDVHGFNNDANLVIPSAALAGGDIVLVTISRLAPIGAGDMGGDARVFGVEFRYTTRSSSAA